jgi:opacity protein-like surface antigen
MSNWRLAGFAVVAATLVAPGLAHARQQQEQTTAVRPIDRTADFLFGRPNTSVGIRGSWIFAGAGSDLFDFITRQLTLDKRNFNTPAFAADVAFNVSSRLQVEAGFEFSRMEQGSEYRDFVDNNLLPIEQTTSLNATHIMGGVRYALSPRGREISRLVWIPSKVVPYVGAGAGVVYYQFRQYGDFVDFVDNSVFYESFNADGWAPTAHVFGGVDVQLHRGLYVSIQGRYTKAAGGLSPDFIDFDPIDLSGFRLSAGINVLF